MKEPRALFRGFINQGNDVPLWCHCFILYQYQSLVKFRGASIDISNNKHTHAHTYIIKYQ